MDKRLIGKKVEQVIEIEVVKRKTMKLEKYYVIRAIKSSKGKKECIAEKECSTEPTGQEIGSFCYEQGATFCSVLENYRLRDLELEDFFDFD